MTTLSGPSARRPRATMRDVAARAGVSLKTVSRVVNREAGVSDLLAEKVQAAAEELNFQLNARRPQPPAVRRPDRPPSGCCWRTSPTPSPPPSHRAVENVARRSGVPCWPAAWTRTPQRERELVATFSFTPGRRPGHHADGRRPRLPDARASGRDPDGVRRPRTRIGSTPTWCWPTTSPAPGKGVAHLLAGGHRHIGFLGDLARIATATAAACRLPRGDARGRADRVATGGDGARRVDRRGRRRRDHRAAQRRPDRRPHCSPRRTS